MKEVHRVTQDEKVFKKVAKEKKEQRNLAGLTRGEGNKMDGSVKRGETPKHSGNIKAR